MLSEFNKKTTVECAGVHTGNIKACSAKEQGKLSNQLKPEVICEIAKNIIVFQCFNIENSEKPT